MEKVLLSVEEAAQALGIGRSKAYELILKGDLISIKLGRSRKVPVEAISAFVKASLENGRIQA